VDDDPLLLSDEVVEVVAALRPVTATFWGVPGHDAAWDDLGPEGHERARGGQARGANQGTTRGHGQDRSTGPFDA